MTALASSWGYPRPSTHLPTAASVTASSLFLEDNAWQAILDYGEFDDIVVGSGFCALAYVDAALRKDPWRKILILERGGLFLPEHFQNLPLPFKASLNSQASTFPWQLTSKTFESEAKHVNASMPFFGGRSTFWSGWCPRAIVTQQDVTFDFMRDFPESMKAKARRPEFWDRCEALLHVTSADKFDEPCFGQGLQNLIQKTLSDMVADRRLSNINFIAHAPLAAGRQAAVPNKINFHKFSVPGPLLDIVERQRNLANNKRGSPLLIAIDTVAERFELDPDGSNHPPRPYVLHTSRGTLCFPKRTTNIILAASEFPATTILMNSIGPSLKDCAGSRVSGQYFSKIVARIPLKAVDLAYSSDCLQIAAFYLAGEDPPARSGLQFHLQVTAIHSPRPATDAADAARLSTDYAAAVAAEQLEGCENHIVLACIAIGEFDGKGTDSWVKHNSGDLDVTTNIRIQVLPDVRMAQCRETMEDAMYKAIELIAGGTPESTSQVEYLHDTSLSDAGWKTTRPPKEAVQSPGIMHTTSTLYMSDDLEKDPHASVDSDYRPRGCDNVFVTGPALFPTAGSWNPVLTISGFAQDLADKLYDKKQKVSGR